MRLAVMPQPQQAHCQLAGETADHLGLSEPIDAELKSQQAEAHEASHLLQLQRVQQPPQQVQSRSS